MLNIHRQRFGFSGATSTALWPKVAMKVALFAMTGVPVGCTMTLSMYEPHKSAEVTETQLAAKAPSGPMTKVQETVKPTAQSKQDKASSETAEAKEPQYLPDKLLETVPTPERVRTPHGGRVVNVFGEFSGSITGNTLSSPALQQVTFPESGYDTEPTVSPTSKSMVFSSTREGDHAQLYAQRPGSTSVIQLTDGNSDSAQPCFSPDGSKLAFCSNRGGNWHLYLMDADGRHVTRITEGPTQDMHPSFSPDATKLVYCSQTPETDQWQLFTIELASGAKKAIGSGLFPSWSPFPGSNRIAFQRARTKGSRWFSLWTMDLIDDEPVNVAEIAVSANAALVGPVWSGDGKRISYVAITEPDSAAAGKPNGAQDIWVSKSDGAERIRVTDGTCNNWSPAWASDKRVYFVSDRDGREAIWSLPVKALASGPEAVAFRENKPGKNDKPATSVARPGSTATADPAEIEK